MASYTLDDIRAAADAKYGSTDIDLGEGRVLVLLNPMRLTKEERAELKAVQDDVNEDEVDEDAQLEGMREIIRVAARRSDLAEVLFAAIGDDVALLASVLEAYNKGTQAGEASASAS